LSQLHQHNGRCILLVPSNLLVQLRQLHPLKAPPESTPEELFVFWLLDYRIDNRDEAEEAHSRCYLHATHTKDVVIENGLVASATAHEYKTEDDNQHSDYHQNEVNLAKCVISFIHFVFILN
jgi:hypothetical protein